MMLRFLHINVPAGKNFWTKNVKKNKERGGEQVNERPSAINALVNRLALPINAASATNKHPSTNIIFF